MFANGSTCEDAAAWLTLPMWTVQSHLRQALQLLEITDAEDLTYVAVAARCNRNVPATATQH